MIESTPSLPPYPSPAKSKGEGREALEREAMDENRPRLLRWAAFAQAVCPDLSRNRAMGANTESVK